MQHITLYQIILAIVAFSIVFQRTVRFLRRGQSQSLVKYVTFVIIWGGIGLISIFPNSAHWIRKTFGFGDNFNTLIFIAFVILFVLFFRMLAIIEKIESQITEVIRKNALRDFKKRRR